MTYSTEALVSAAATATGNETRLSICRKPNGFSFALTSGNELLTVAEARREGEGSLTDEAAAIKQYFESLGIKIFDLTKTEIVAVTDNFAWVPEELYTQGMEHQYLSLVDPSSVAAAVYTEHNPNLKSRIVFSVNDSLLTAFKIALPGLVVTCQHAKLANQTLASACGPDGMAVLHLRTDKADVAVYNGGRYLMGRTLQVDGVESLIFDVLEIIKTLNVENDRFRLLLCGDVSRESYAAIRPYFASVALYTGRPWTLSTDELRHLHTYRHALILS
ncbi:MAG: DUF3822 family protein [Bacteroidales bacterium]|nr:DUF3822 family protein [Bacteroidales bacterium]